MSSFEEHNEDLIETRIQVHDTQQVEVKLDYSIDPSHRRNRYHIKGYFFVPQSLGITKHTYSRSRFYRDVQSYIRFKTPRISFSDILNEKNEKSPLWRIERTLEARAKGNIDKTSDRALTRELRIFVCLVRANLRDELSRLIQSDLENSENTAARQELIDILDGLSGVVAAFRAMKPQLTAQNGPGSVAEAYRYTDEYLSLVVESHLTQFLSKLQRHESNDAMVGRCIQEATSILTREREHRDECDYPRILEDGVPNEHYVYRRGLLKKFAMSVLFLKLNRDTGDNKVSDIIAAIAAGIAMLFAAVAAIYAQNRYGLNTGPFVGALVVSYILKDRIKDWVKRYSAPAIANLLWDHRIDITDPLHDVQVGRCRELFAFISNSSIPKPILDLRHGGQRESIEAQSKQEVYLKYEKEIILHGTTIDQSHGRMLDINDIIRFNLSQFLARTDDPVSYLPLFNVKTQQIDKVACPKVYHINVILVLEAETGNLPAQMVRIRVIFDRAGIRRVETS